MPRIGTALEACNNIIGGRQYIDDLPFAFIAPLQPEEHIDLFHCMCICCIVCCQLALGLYAQRMSGA